MSLVSRAAVALALLAAASCTPDHAPPSKKSSGGFVFAPASAFPRPDRACTFGADQSCNDDPAISSIHGTCNQDGTCSCQPGFHQSPTTGRCQ